MDIANWCCVPEHRGSADCEPAHRRSVLLEEAAVLLGVSRRTIYYRIRDGKLRTIRTRGGSQRVLLESLEALLREQAERRRRPAAR